MSALYSNLQSSLGQPKSDNGNTSKNEPTQLKSFACQEPFQSEQTFATR